MINNTEEDIHDTPSSPLQRLASSLFGGDKEGNNTPEVAARENIIGRISPTAAAADPIPTFPSTASFSREASPIADGRPNSSVHNIQKQTSVVLPPAMQLQLSASDRSLMAPVAANNSNNSRDRSGSSVSGEVVCSTTSTPKRSLFIGEEQDTRRQEWSTNSAAPQHRVTRQLYEAQHRRHPSVRAEDSSPYAGCSPEEAFLRRGAVPTPSPDGVCGLSYVGKQRLDDPMCFDCGACGEQSSGQFCHNCGARCVLKNVTLGEVSPARSKRRLHRN